MILDPMPLPGYICIQPYSHAFWVPLVFSGRVLIEPLVVESAMPVVTVRASRRRRQPTSRKTIIGGTLVMLACPLCCHQRRQGWRSQRVQLRSSDLGPVPTDYDFGGSTEDYYGVTQFVGAHAEIRALLDYSWHKLYHPTRVDVQDKLICNLCEQGSMSKSDLLPWVVFTAGAMGAGKGHVVRWMQKHNYLPLDRFVVVDPDQIRQSLPEWPGYLAQGAARAGELTQKEAGCMAEILGYKALRNRWNVVFDGSLRDAKWYTTYFQQIREQFPGIRIMILHVVAEKEQVLNWAERRAQKTGRVVPREVLLETIKAVPESVRALAPFADFVCRIRNTIGSEPCLEREIGAPYPAESISVSWDLIGLLWRDIDTNGHGELEKEEVDAAIAQGILTEAVVQSIDTNGDGAISKEELRLAEVQAAHCRRMGMRPLWEELDEGVGE